MPYVQTDPPNISGLNGTGCLIDSWMMGLSGQAVGPLPIIASESLLRRGVAIAH